MSNSSVVLALVHRQCFTHVNIVQYGFPCSILRSNAILIHHSGFVFLFFFFTKLRSLLKFRDLFLRSAADATSGDSVAAPRQQTRQVTLATITLAFSSHEIFFAHLFSSFMLSFGCVGIPAWLVWF